MIRRRYLVTFITVVNLGVSHDYGDKTKLLLVVRITLLSTHLSHRPFCLEISIDNVSFDTNIDNSTCEGSRLEYILVNLVHVLFYIYSK